LRYGGEERGLVDGEVPLEHSVDLWIGGFSVWFAETCAASLEESLGAHCYGLDTWDSVGQEAGAGAGGTFGG